MGTFYRRGFVAMILSGLFFWLTPEFEKAVGVPSIVYSIAVLLTMYCIAKVMFWTNCNHVNPYEELRWIPVRYFRTRAGTVDQRRKWCSDYMVTRGIPVNDLILLAEIKRYYRYRAWPFYDSKHTDTCELRRGECRHGKSHK